MRLDMVTYGQRDMRATRCAARVPELETDLTPVAESVRFSTH